MINKSSGNQYDELQKRLKEAFGEIEELKEQLKKYKVVNARGAGRKGRMTEEDKKQVIALRVSGMSYNAIAKKLKLPVGSVFNYLKLNLNSLNIIEKTIDCNKPVVEATTATVNGANPDQIIEKMLYRDIMRKVLSR